MNKSFFLYNRDNWACLLQLDRLLLNQRLVTENNRTHSLQCIHNSEPPFTPLQWNLQIKDPPRKRTTSHKGHHNVPEVLISHFETSEKRTASPQWTQWVLPKCPLFRGSTIELTLEVIFPQLEVLEGVVAGEGDEMEAPVHGVVDANHPHIANHPLREEQLLPGPTEVLRAVHHCHPVLVVQRNLDYV